MLLNPALDRKADFTIKRLETLDEVTKKLWQVDATIRTARAFFDAVLEDYTSLCDRLASDVHIAHNLKFESGILEIQERDEALLNVIKK